MRNVGLEIAGGGGVVLRNVVIVKVRQTERVMTLDNILTYCCELNKLSTDIGRGTCKL